MDLGLSGRTALVTGASRGIGRGIAEALAAEGCHLELVARNAEMLEELAGSLAGEHGVRARAYAYDLAEPANQKAVVAACGHADIVVNNAGATQPGEIDEVDEDAWMDGWRLKVFGYINMTRHYWRIMKARGSGVIVNIVGDSGERPVAAVISSSTANAALIAFTRALGGRSPQFGFRVVGVNPAAIETDRVYWYMRARAERTLGSAERWPELLGDLPFGRMGAPKDIGAMVAFLASDRASYISGCIMSVDGGRAARP